MNITLFIIILVILQLVCLITGNRASKNLKNEQDYFLAGKEVRFFPLMMTFVATQIGGGLILGASEEAYRFGWSVFLYPLGACLGFLLLASGIGKKLAQFQVSTVAQLFETVYQSATLKKIASLLSIVSLFMILIAQVIASKKFMGSLGINQMEFFLLFWGLIILYTAIGGLKAVVSIDIVQAAYFIGVFIFGFCFILYTQGSGWSEPIYTGLNSGAFSFDSSKLSGWLFMPLLFMVIEQDMAQRCFAAQSPKVVSKAATWSAVITLIVCIIPIWFGILGKNSGLSISENESIFMTVVQSMTSPILAAFIGCAVLMAIISTAISLINAVSSNLTQDFNFTFFSKISDLKKSRLITSIIGVGAVFGSFYFTNVVDLLITSYELSVYCLFVPVFAALFNSQGNKLAAIMSIVFGAGAFVLFLFVSVNFPKEIICVAISGLGYVLGKVASPALSKKWIMH